MMAAQTRERWINADSPIGYLGETATGSVPEDCHPKIRQLFDYWRSIHPAHGLPGRRRFDPLDVPRLLPNLCLVDAPMPPRDFTFRLMGTRLELFFGANFTGEPFISAYQKNRQSRAYLDVSAIVRDCLPRWWRGPARFVENREYVVTERLYLPLASDGIRVDMILGILLAKIGNETFA